MATTRRRPENQSLRLRRWGLAVVCSVAGHTLLAFFLLLTGFFHTFSRLSPLAPANPVVLRSVPQSVWSQNRQVGPRPQVKAPPDPDSPKLQAKKEEEKKKEPEPIPKGKVVDVAPGNGLKPDDDAEFLAGTNNRVDKQTRSRDATPFYKNAMPRPSSPQKPSDGKGQDLVDKEVIAGNGGRGSEDLPYKDGSKRSIFELPSVKKSDELALRFDGLGGKMVNQPGSDEVRGNSDRLKIQVGGPEGEDSQASAGRAGSQELQTLTPSATVLDRIAGAPANDLTPMDDLEVGDGTYLNTREWKHSSFFNRIKQYVGMHWNPNVVMRTKDPTGEIYLYKDRYTVVAVTLGDDGKLRNIAVDRSCGVDFLDREAIAAFQRAQPFPNPPPALRNDHGEIRFTFGFYLEVGRGGLDLFRPAR